MPTDISRKSMPLVPPAIQRDAASMLRKLARFLALAWQVARERNELRTLDARLLRDIGIAPDVAEREAARDAFDVPLGRYHRWP